MMIDQINKPKKAYVWSTYAYIFFSSTCFQIMGIDSLWMYCDFLLIGYWCLMLAGGKYDIKFQNYSLVWLYIVIAFVSLGNTVVNFGQPIYYAFNIYRWAALIFAYFPLVFFAQRLGLNCFLNIILNCDKMLVFLLLLQLILYPSIEFMDGLSEGRYGFGYRSLSGALLMTYVVLVLLYKFMFLAIQLKEKIYLMIWLSLNIFCLMFISQTRSVMFLLVIMALLMLGLKAKRKLRRGIPRSILFFVLIVLVLVMAFNYVMLAFNASYNIQEASSVQRLGALNYYWEMICENPWLGYGKYHDAYTFGQLLHGTQYKFYIEDVGLIGFVFEFGLLGVAYLLFTGITYLKAYNKISGKKRMFSLLLLFFAIIILPFNCYYNTGDLAYVAVFWAIVEAQVHGASFR